MYTYEVIRLIIMATILVYFVGSFTYLVSDKLNIYHEHDEGQENFDKLDDESFIEKFDLKRYSP